MKFFKSLLIALLCTVMLTACATQKGVPLPSSSANFDEEFLSTFQEEYYMYDHQLIDVSTVPWEAELTISAEKNHSYKTMRFAMVEQYPEKELVSVTHVYDDSPSIFAGSIYGLKNRIYQNTDICPIRDWEISEITVVWAVSLYEMNYESREPSELDLPRNKNLITQSKYPFRMYRTFTDEKDQGFIKQLQNSFQDQNVLLDITPKQMKATVTLSKEEKRWHNQGDCGLLIRFAQCPQIVWLGGLYMLEDELYIRCPYTDENGNRDYGYCLLPEEFAAEVLQIFKENCISVGTDLKYY